MIYIASFARCDYMHTLNIYSGRPMPRCINIFTHTSLHVKLQKNTSSPPGRYALLIIASGPILTPPGKWLCSGHGRTSVSYTITRLTLQCIAHTTNRATYLPTCPRRVGNRMSSSWKTTPHAYLPSSTACNLFQTKSQMCCRIHLFAQAMPLYPGK